MNSITDRARHMPYPEIVEAVGGAKPYSIIDTNEGTHSSSGMVNKQARRLGVPLEAGSRHVARHELAHVRWSPARPPRVLYEPCVLLAVEDARINMGLARIGLPLWMSSRDRAHVRRLTAIDLDAGKLLAFVLRAIASIETNAESDVIEPASDYRPEICELALRLRSCVRTRLAASRDRRGGPVAAFSHAMRVARDIARELEALGLIRKPDSPRLADLAGGCSLCHADGAADAGGDSRGKAPPGGSGGGTHAGEMTIADAPLETRIMLPSAAWRREWRPATEGSVVRSIHRLPIDGAVFRRSARKKPGGTVLVDTSGSMHLGVRDLDRMLRESPAAMLVAIYSGKGVRGQLRVVARNGWRAEAAHLKPFGSGNIVDLPALQWLARQPSPRVWVSDGGVTGVGDKSSQQLRDRCKAVCSEAHIRRVADIEAAAKLLADGR